MSIEVFLISLNAPSWAEVITLIETLIWPLTVIVCLAFYRGPLGNIIDRLGSVKASPTGGFELNFQEKLNETLALPALKSSGDTAKSGGTINIQGSTAGTPYEQLLEIRDVLNDKIRKRARDLNIDPTHMSNYAVSDKLKEVGGITYQQSKGYEALIELMNSANHNITQAQVNLVKSAVNNLDI